MGDLLLYTTHIIDNSTVPFIYLMLTTSEL
jgi:hypothetical protein